MSASEPKYAHEMEEGDEYEPLEFTITPEINQQFLFALEDFDPQYVDGDEAGAALVHPVLLLHMSARTRSPSFRLAPDSGSIFAREHVEFLNPARVGQRLRASWRWTGGAMQSSTWSRCGVSTRMRSSTGSPSAARSTTR